MSGVNLGKFANLLETARSIDGTRVRALRLSGHDYNGHNPISWSEIGSVFALLPSSSCSTQLWALALASVRAAGDLARSRTVLATAPRHACIVGRSCWLWLQQPFSMARKGSRKGNSSTSAGLAPPPVRFTIMLLVPIPSHGRLSNIT